MNIDAPACATQLAMHITARPLSPSCTLEPRKVPVPQLLHHKVQLLLQLRGRAAEAQVPQSIRGVGGRAPGEGRALGAGGAGGARGLRARAAAAAPFGAAVPVLRADREEPPEGAPRVLVRV